MEKKNIGMQKKTIKSLLKSKKYREYFTAYLFLLPWIIGMFAFTIGPFVYSFILSFTKSDIFTIKFNGMDNFKQMFLDDPVFIKSLVVTSKYVFLSVPLKLSFALFIAVLLEKNIRGLYIYRTVYYLPSLIGGSVAVAVMWRKIFSLDGLLNGFLSIFGLHGKEWLGEPKYALNILVLLSIWQFGSSMVIFLAGLKNIPKELYEASAIDGSGSFKTFKNITLPMLSPIILFNLILQTIGAFQTFTQGFMITGGGPMNETRFSVLYIYEKAFTSLRMGYASGMSWILLLIIALVTGLLFYFSKYWVFYENK